MIGEKDKININVCNVEINLPYIPLGKPGKFYFLTNSKISTTSGLIDDGLRPLLKTSYEVWSVFVEDKNDCEKLADSMHLLFHDCHPVKRAKNVVGMYFLQPTGFDTKSQPALMTGTIKSFSFSISTTTQPQRSYVITY